MTQLTNPRNNTWKIFYDADGRLIKDEDALTGAKTLSRNILPDGFQVTLKDALNRPTVYQTEFLNNGEEHRLNTFPDGTQDSSIIRPDYSLSLHAPDGTTTDIIRSADSRFGMQAPLIKSATIRTPSGLTSLLEKTRTTVLSNPQDL